MEEIPLPQSLLPETAPAHIPLPPGLELPPPPAAGILKRHPAAADSRCVSGQPGARARGNTPEARHGRLVWSVCLAGVRVA